MRYLIPLLLATTTPVLAAPPAPKAASPATVEAQKAVAAALPKEDGRDAAFADQGFVATRANPVIITAEGKPVWNLDAYAWMEGEAPATVNPSLWRHMKLLRKHGLYKVADNVWQVRGFDVSNMTVIKGGSGWILIDPLTTKEAAAAALELVNQQLGTRPVTGVIYSHSHADHYGGVRGVLPEADANSAKAAIIAPQFLIEEASSENVIAGAAMGRRANYQFGAHLQPGPQGQMGSGIGKGISGGSITMVTPKDLIRKTGDTRLVDGVLLEFQMVPETEAPAEMNVYIPSAKTFLAAEIATCSLHNILTPRGAKVRDALAWSQYLNQAVSLYAARSDAAISSHCWPRFGQAEVKSWLEGHRDNYRYLHDQTVRLMNQGLTQAEIAEAIQPPAVLSDQWYNKGYYGTYSHNSKAVYQRYLGWYDAVPANLNPHPPAERDKRMVAAMGGSKKLIAEAKRAMAKGDYRWSSDLLNMLIFAEPQNATGRALLADSYEQQGYQAESAIWRNQFLSAAYELRNGVKPSVTNQSPDMIAAIPTGLLLESVATRIDPAKLGSQSLAINLVIADRSEKAKITLNNGVMISEMDDAHTAPAATILAPRPLLLAMLFLKMPLAQLEAAGLKIEGDRAVVEALQNALDPVPSGFNIAEP